VNVPLSDAIDERLFGGKARQLAESVRAGFPVPPGFALSVDLVDAIANGDDRALDAVCQSAGALGPLAVRSSAVGEDSAGASFAGQHDTVLDVRGRSALDDAIRQVWASGQSASAQGYRARMGQPVQARMAIVVQQLVHADTAGVMFTRNPLTGADERVIEAAWGLGEAVVGGLVTPDQYRVRRGGLVLEQTAGDKDIAIRPMAGGGTSEQPVEPHLAAALCLSDGDLQALDRLASLCEAHHGPGPHDIEFAFAGGALFLLQRRAITRTGAQ
jgi:pyruvate, water dikinase